MVEFHEEEYDQGFDFGLWKKIFLIAKPYWKYLYIMFPLMAFTAALNVFFQYFNRYVIDNIIVPREVEKVPLIAAVYLVAGLLQAFNILCFIRLAGKVEVGVAYSIRQKGFKKLQELSLSYYDRTKVGWIMARMTADTSRLSEMLSWGLLDTSLGISMMFMIVVLMMSQNWRLALITMTVLPALLVAAIYLQRKILKAFRKVRRTNSQITGSFNEGISGAKTTKTLLTEDKNNREFDKLTGKMRYSSVRAAIYSALLWPVVITLGNIGMALALSAGGRMVILGEISLGTMAMFVSLVGMFFMPVQDLARILAEYQRAQASGERIMSLLETEPDIDDGKEITSVYGDSFKPKLKNWPEVEGEISFENVSFQYIEGEKVLDDFNLDIKKGESIALVGETGSGKTTIVNLACRFYQPSAGSIKIDGVDYKERSQQWLQSNLGYVLQTPHLFSGTIKENIAYGKLDATDAEIVEAAKIVRAHEFIVKMDKGYNSEVGEVGGNLSTGQKQLLSFARTILADPKILVLDEATSSVDTETEFLIQKAVEKVLKGRTSFIIAHRLSTIRHADRILVLEKGKIIEEGTHHQLIKNRKRYFQLYTNQFIEEQEIKALSA